VINDKATLTQIGSVMGVDHSTVIYYKRMHDSYLFGYPLYKEMMAIAESVVMDVFIPSAAASKRDEVSRIIEGLEKQIKVLRAMVDA
jgi:hypothetical protein